MDARRSTRAAWIPPASACGCLSWWLRRYSALLTVCAFPRWFGLCLCHTPYVVCVRVAWVERHQLKVAQTRCRTKVRAPRARRGLVDPTTQRPSHAITVWCERQMRRMWIVAVFAGRGAARLAKRVLWMIPTRASRSDASTHMRPAPRAGAHRPGDSLTTMALPWPPCCKTVAPVTRPSTTSQLYSGMPGGARAVSHFVAAPASL